MLKHIVQYLFAECGENVNTQEELKEHEESHKNEFLQATLTCLTCNKQFLNEHSIKQHMQSKHSSLKQNFLVGHPQRYQRKAVSQNITCVKCSKVFATGRDVEDQMVEHSTENEYNIEFKNPSKDKVCRFFRSGWC